MSTILPFLIAFVAFVAGVLAPHILRPVTRRLNLPNLPIGRRRTSRRPHDSPVVPTAYPTAEPVSVQNAGKDIMMTSLPKPRSAAPGGALESARRVSSPPLPSPSSTIASGSSLSQTSTQVPIGRGGAGPLRTDIGEAYAVAAAGRWALVVMDEPGIDYRLGSYPLRASAPTILSTASTLTIADRRGRTETIDLSDFATGVPPQRWNVRLGGRLPSDPEVLTATGGGVVVLARWVDRTTLVAPAASAVLEGAHALWLPGDPTVTLDAVAAELSAAGGSHFDLTIAGGGNDGGIVAVRPAGGEPTVEVLPVGPTQRAFGDNVVTLVVEPATGQPKVPVT